MFIGSERFLVPVPYNQSSTLAAYNFCYAHAPTDKSRCVSLLSSELDKKHIGKNPLVQVGVEEWMNVCTEVGREVCACVGR